MRARPLFVARARARRAVVAALLLAHAGLGAAPAAAQDAVQQALQRGYEGDRLYARGAWAEAYRQFADAEALAHSPVFVLYMARCRKNDGRLLEARALYARVAAEALPDTAPQPFRAARDDARAEGAELERRIVAIRVRVRGAPAAAVTIDGQASVAGERAVPLDPGAHRVEVRDGARVRSRDVDLAEGSGTTTVEIDLAARPSAPPASGGEPGSLTPAWIALGIGLTGVAAGAVAGGLAMSRADAVKEGCVGDHCLQSDAGDLESARSLALASTLSFAVGGVGLAAAGVLFVVRPGGSAAAPSALGGAPLWLGARGSF